MNLLMRIAPVRIAADGIVGPPVDKNTNDNIVGTDANDYIGAGGGDDRVSGGGGKDTLTGARGDDRLSGDGGDDKLLGGSGDDDLRGGSGDDILKGDAGNDRLEGGSGSDTFVFGGRKGGTDRIVDFSDADSINLQRSGADSIGDLDIRNHNDGVLIDYGGGKIIVEDLSVADIDSNDFVF